MKKITLVVLYLIFFVSYIFSDDITVYITSSGTKYHLENCSSLQKSKIPIKLSDAIAQRYEACKRCHPPVSLSKEKDVTEAKIESVLDIGNEEIALPFCEYPERIINHTGYSLLYSEKDEQALWVAYLLTAEEVSGDIARSDNFRADLCIPTGSASLNDYRGSGYDRGHLIPAADLTWSVDAMKDSFYLSNMSPQNPGFNRGVWKRLEEWVREHALKNLAVYVVTSPILNDGPYETIGENKVSIPKKYYKVILDYIEPDIKAIGFIIPNQPSPADLSTFAVPINEVEEATGIDFFYLLPDDIEEALESDINYNKW